MGAFCALALALTLLAAGCGKDDYPLQVREQFTVACLDSSKATLAVRNPEDGEDATGRKAKKYCNCVLERLVEKMPYKDFAALNSAMEKGEAPSGANMDLLEKVIAECGGAALDDK